VDPVSRTQLGLEEGGGKGGGTALCTLLTCSVAETHEQFIPVAIQLAPPTAAARESAVFTSVRLATLSDTAASS
jgi:hypothetical protein